MYEISIADGFVALCDSVTGTSAKIAPGRGALLTSLMKNGQEYMYFDGENFASDDRPRCGMPVLFPCCGRNTDETVHLKGNAYPMGIHGFGHTSPWQIAGTCADESCAQVTLTLTDTEKTRTHYPYAFRLELTFRLAEGTLTVTHTCTNLDADTMPFDFGYHPYFKISSLQNAELSAAGKEPFFLPDGPEAGSFLPGSAGPVQLHDLADGRKIQLSYSSNFGAMVFWSIPAKKFVCMEPWQGGPDGLNNGRAALLQPGTSASGEITLQPL